MTLQRWAVVAAAVAGAAPAAHADELRSTLDQPLVEVSHTVDIAIQDGVARYTVRRQFANAGTVADEAGLDIDLPTGAAATGLRIRARGRWHTGELLERGAAAARYQELTGLGAHDPKDPALLQWIEPSKLHLQVFPVLPGEISTVEYTLTVPTRYAAGRYWIDYPRVDPAALDAGARPLALPVIAVTTPSPGVVIDGKRAAPGVAVSLAPRIGATWIDQEYARIPGGRAISTVEVPPSARSQRAFATASIDLDVRARSVHELRVDLITPDHRRIAVAQGADGDELRGRFEVRLPAGTRGAGTWRLVVVNAAADDAVLERWELTLGELRAAPADTPACVPAEPRDGAAMIGVAATATPMWTLRLGQVIASDRHAFARLEIDTAAELVPPPRRAQVVFVIDASYSAGPDLLAAQLAIARAYAGHVPDAELELVAYRRTAARVFGRFVPARELDRAIAEARRTGALALGNGSALDDGARVAAAALAGRSGPHRVVIATDELIRSSLTAELALPSLAALDPGAVVHVVVPELAHDRRIGLVRDDDADLASLATRHHGIFARLSGLPAPRDAELAAAVTELVRPIRIEQLSVIGGVAIDVTELREGAGLRVLAAGTAAPARVVVSGKLWSDPIRTEVSASPAFTRRAAAFVFGLDQHGELSNAEMMRVARLGRAVSPVTSYLAIEPGVRPSPIGLPGGGGTGWGTIGSGRYGTIGHGGHSGRVQPDLRSLVDTTGCLRAYPPAAPWTVTLEVETTKDEIVDVKLDDGAGALASCLVEATWAVRLDRRFDQAHETFSLELHGD